VRRLRFLIQHRLKTSLWLIPFACALAGIVLSLLTVGIDRAVGDGLVPRSITGDPSSALIVLSTVAASMVSLTALVLTITSVVVQLAMGQFSPRSVRPFLQDRPSQFAIGVFVGAFAHAMFAMREVHSFGQEGSVPGVTIVVSYLLVFVSVVVLVAYVHHIANSLKVDSIIQSVGAETRSVLDKLYRPRSPSEAAVSGSSAITASRAGMIFRVDHEELISLARGAGGTLHLGYGVGSFVPEGAALFRWEGKGAPPDPASVRRCVAIGPERTMDQDGAFGIQILVDITERALSDSFNDQTTAAQGVDRLHDILRALAGRRFPSGRFPDAGGDERLVVPELGWDDYVGLAVDRVIHAAERSPAVLERIRGALEDLLTVTPEDRRAAVEARLHQLPRSRPDPVLDLGTTEEHARA